MKGGLKIFMALAVLLFLFAGCANKSAPSHRAPVNGWHKSGHHDNAASYHYNSAKQVPF